MKKTLLLLLLTALASLTIANYGLAFDTAQNVAATAITSLPTVISSPGNYYLAPNFNINPANNQWQILITASNVTLDLNNQNIAIGYSSYGLCINGGTNVIVQNGNIGENGISGVSWGFTYPLYLQNASYCTIKNVITGGINAGVLDLSGVHNQFQDSTFTALDVNGNGPSFYLYNCSNDLVDNCTLIARPTTWGAISYGSSQYGGNVFRNVNISFETKTPPYYGLYLQATDMVKGVAANAPVNVTFIYGTANVVD
jgi:hypothetical protein